jgi:membrane associated rhomboid family serine protease
MNAQDAADEEGPLALVLHPPGAVAALGSALALVYAVTGLMPAATVHRLWHMFELSPARAFHAVETGAYFSGVVRPYLGHMVFHINLTHLLVNLAAVVLCGSFVHREMELQAGSRRNDAPAAFIAFFLLCGLAGGFAFALADPRSAQSVVGASGAAAGLFGACAWILIMRFGGEGERLGDMRRIAMLALFSVLVVGASVVLDNSSVSRLLFGSASAWQAHVGGYVAGLLTYPLFEKIAASGR